MPDLPTIEALGDDLNASSTPGVSQSMVSWLVELLTVTIALRPACYNAALSGSAFITFEVRQDGTVGIRGQDQGITRFKAATGIDRARVIMPPA